MRHSGTWRRFVGMAVLAVIGVLVGALTAGAAPMNGDAVTIRQSDGSLIELLVWGDEFYAVGETPDGYTVVRDPESGLYCYAGLSANGRELVSTGVRADHGTPPPDSPRHLRIDADAVTEKAREVRSAFEERQLAGVTVVPDPPGRSRGTSTGEVMGLTIIVDFSDDVGTIPPENIDDYCNELGYTGYSNNGSVRDYFSDVSGGLLDYTNYVATEYYRANYTKEYYCDPGVSYGTRAQQLIREALNAMEAAGFDFSEYDADGNGVIDALNCFYAGNTWNNWAEGLWPHCGWVQWCADGVCTQRYQISNLGSSLRLGTFCHENGHMLMGWPDLYDYDGDSRGVGQFCVMCSVGPGTNPIEPCAYMKYTAGWGDVSYPSGYENGLSVPSTGNVIYKFDHPTDSNEYYLIENRQQSGRDAAIPDHGLAIWHCDENGDNSDQQQTPELHYEVTLVQADGDWDLENNRNYGDNTDLYAATAFTECSPLTDPDTGWWDGSDSDFYFMNISPSGATMTFDFAHGPPFYPAFTAPVYACETGCSTTATYAVTMYNPGSQSGVAEVDVAHECMPEGVDPSDWVVSYREVGGSWLTSPTTFGLGPGDDVSLEVRVEDTMGTVPGMDVSCLTATCTSDPDVSNAISFATFFDAPSILIVDDDNGAANETYLETALADTGYAGHVYDVEGRGRPTLEQLSSYWAVFWTTAQGLATYITSTDEQNMMDYLDAGGNLFLTSSGYLSSRAAANTFTSDYLHIDSWTADEGGFSVVGATGDEISGGMSLMLVGGPISCNYADSITPTSPASTIFAVQGDPRGLKVSEDGHKLVFLSFAFENVKTTNPAPDNQKTLVARTIEWFQGGTGVDETDGAIAGRLSIAQNYPNPFNPTTSITFALPRPVDRATLRIYNVNGRVVRTLVDGPLEAGRGSVVWDGTSDSGRVLGSGVYFASLEAEGESVQRKMTLLK